MNLLADESIDRQIVERLRQDGHDTVAIAELSPSVSDDQVLDEANQRQSLLVTADKDFGELVYRLNRVHGGVLLVRLPGLSPGTKAELVARTLQSHGPQLVGQFAVLAPGSLRIRRADGDDPPT